MQKIHVYIPKMEAYSILDFSKVSDEIRETIEVLTINDEHSPLVKYSQNPSTLMRYQEDVG